MLVSPIKVALLSTIRAFIFVFADHFEEGEKVLSMVLGSRVLRFNLWGLVVQVTSNGLHFDRRGNIC
jgi:hypothetical protein